MSSCIYSLQYRTFGLRCSLRLIRTLHKLNPLSHHQDRLVCTFLKLQYQQTISPWFLLFLLLSISKSQILCYKYLPLEVEDLQQIITVKSMTEIVVNDANFFIFSFTINLDTVKISIYKISSIKFLNSIFKLVLNNIFCKKY